MKTIDDHLSICSTRPSPDSPIGQQWEKGARQGWDWAMESEKMKDSLAQRLAEKDELVQEKIRNLEGMAQSMDMLREDLIGISLIDNTVPPMFMSEAIIKAVVKAYNAGKNGEDLWPSFLPTQPGSAGS